jgi:hypothetical protein
MDNDDLKIGDRVRLTPLGEQRNAGLKMRTGTIKGRTRGNGYYVLIDGNKTASTLHRSYVEAETAEPGQATSCFTQRPEAGKSGC